MAAISPVRALARSAVRVAVIVLAAVLAVASAARGQQPIGPTGVMAPVPGELLAGEALVVHVHDGDSLSVVQGFTDRGRVFRPRGPRGRVRLLGIDAPEAARLGYAAQPGSGRATRALARLVLGKVVILEGDETADRVDRYGRTLAYVSVGGVDVGAILVGDGRARADGEHRYSRRDLYCGLEAAARAKPEGIWRLRRNPKPSRCPASGKGS